MYIYITPRRTMLVTVRTMEHHGEEGSKTSKNAAKKEAAKLVKLQKKQQHASAAAAAAVEAMTLDGPDPLATNYGEVPLEDLQSKPITGRFWTAVSSLTPDLKDQTVLIRGHAQTIRSLSKKIAFLVIREGGFTVQCVLAVAANLVSPQMVKFANSISKESIVDVEGVISVPKDPIKGASQQQVEIQVRKLYLVDKAPSPLPTNIQDAEIEEAQKVSSTIRRINHEKMNYQKASKQRRTIPNTYGENLVGILHDTGSAEIVILCHGFLSSKESIILTNLAAALEKEGITSFRFDFSGIGESEGPFRFAGYWKEAEDLRAVIQHFKQKENRVTSAIIGHSRGGNAVLLYASKYRDICTVVNISGRYDLRKGIARRLGEDFSERIKKEGYLDVKNKKGEVEYRVTEEALLDRQNTNMHKACLQIDKKCRVLTVHGSDDKIIPVQDALEFSKIIPKWWASEGRGRGKMTWVGDALRIKVSSTIRRINHEKMNYQKASKQRRTIPNTYGENLVGILHDTGSAEIVILCHGFLSSKESIILTNLAAALEKEGITSFRFDFSGIGESEGPFRFAGYWKEAEDLRAVIQHFKQKENRVTSAIIGHSRGGNAVLLYASKYRDICTVVNISGRYDLRKGIARRLGEDFSERIKKEGYLDVKNKKGEVEYRVTEEALLDRQNTNMHKACLQIDKKCRVLTVHGSDDKIIPVQDALEFSKIIPKWWASEGRGRGKMTWVGDALRIKVSSTIRRINHEKMNYQKASKQRRTIPNTYGENLVGILHDTGSAEIVILCHGFLSSKESIILTNLAAALEKEGITSFRFDFSGIGESEGPFRFAGYWKEAEDLRAVIQHFKQKENRVTSAIIGHSRGGNAVLLYASKYRDICTVVNISGRYDLRKGIARRLGEDFSERIKKEGYLDVKNKKGEVEYRVTEEALLDRQNTNMHKACLQIDKKCRVLTVHGSDDKIIPVQDALEFSKIIPKWWASEGRGRGKMTWVGDALRIKVSSTIRRINHEKMNYQKASKQRRTIPNTYGENLVGILHDTGSAEIVILCHGFLSSKESIILTNLAAALEKEGITSFRFDFSGIGESEGPFRFAGYWKEAEDLRAVIQHFKQKENRVTSAIIGHSRGGNAVLLYASKYRDICTVVNISGRYDLRKGIARRLGEDFSERIKKEGYLDVKNKKGEVEYRVTEEALLDRQNTNMHKACLQIDKKCRVLTVHGSDDKIIPVQDALEFSKIIPNHKLHIVKGANHGYYSHQADLAAVILPFIIKGANEVIED